MSTLTRKQREIANRHSLFLDIAKRLIQENGYHQLSMDRIAELAEYSKGTLYQHFPCKEQILVELCNNNLRRLAALVEKSASVTGNTRERMFAFFLAHEYWQQSNPEDIEMMQNIHHDGVLVKAAPESQQEHLALEARIVMIASQIIEAARSQGELPDGPLNPPEIVYALWAMCHGARILCHYGIPLQEFGVRSPYRSIAHTLQCTLNGYNWQPLMTDHDSAALEKRFSAELGFELVEQTPSAQPTTHALDMPSKMTVLP